MNSNRTRRSIACLAIALLLMFTVLEARHSHADSTAPQQGASQCLLCVFAVTLQAPALARVLPPCGLVVQSVAALEPVSAKRPVVPTIDSRPPPVV